MATYPKYKGYGDISDMNNYTDPDGVLTEDIEEHKEQINECECGAKFDRDFPDNHMQWCPAYRGRK